MNVDVAYKTLGLKVTETIDGKFEVTTLDGTKATKLLTSEDLREFNQSLAKLVGGNTAKQIQRSVRIHGSATDVMLGSSKEIGETFIKISEKFGEAFAADLAGRFLKLSIESLIPEN